MCPIVIQQWDLQPLNNTVWSNNRLDESFVLLGPCLQPERYVFLVAVDICSWGSRCVWFGLVQASLQRCMAKHTALNPKDINKLQLEGLVKSGAFDKLEKNRKGIFETIPKLIQLSFKNSLLREFFFCWLFTGKHRIFIWNNYVYNYNNYNFIL